MIINKLIYWIRKSLRIKFKVNPQQLGGVLYLLAIRIAKSDLNNEQWAKMLGIEEVDRNYLGTEMLICNFFFITQAFQGLLGNKQLENKILDNMHLSYYKDFMRLDKQEGIEINDPVFAEVRHHITGRYEEYLPLFQSDQMTTLAYHILNNLKSKSPFDYTGMIVLQQGGLIMMQSVTELISEYQVVENGESGGHHTE